MFHEFLAANTEEILARTRAKVAARTAPLPSEAALKNGVPLFLGQLIDRLRRTTVDSGAIAKGAAQHGVELHAIGFTVGQVIHGYGDVCQVITRLADEADAPISADEFQTFHRCLDDAMAHAVTAYQGCRDERTVDEEAARLGLLASELHRRLNEAVLASTILEKGRVAISGSTGAVLGRNLRGMGRIVNAALASERPTPAGGAAQSALGVRAVAIEVEAVEPPPDGRAAEIDCRGA